MTSTKKQAINLIKKLPDDFSFEDIKEVLYKLYVIKNIQRGLQDFEDRRYISLEESKKRLLGKK